MKNKLIISLILPFVLVSSCTKQDLINQDNKIPDNGNYQIIDQGYLLGDNSIYWTESVIKEINFVEEAKFDALLKTATYGLLELSKNPSFREMVHNEVAKRFDGDDNVLLKTINEKSMNIGINCLTAFKNSIDLYNDGTVKGDIGSIKEAIDGFMYGGKMAYFQIYIPYFETVNLNQDPIITMNANDEDTLPGLISSSLDTVDATLDKLDVVEDMADDQLIWIISVNERIDEDIYISDTLTSIVGSPTPKCIKISNINISDKKEGWGNGRADISFIGFQLNMSTCIYDGPFQRMPFEKISNGELNSWKSTYAALAGCEGGLSPLVNNEYVGYILFELDRRTKFTRRHTHYDGTCHKTFSFYYISKEPWYGGTSVHYGDYTSTNYWQEASEIGYPAFSGAKIKISHKYSN